MLHPVRSNLSGLSVADTAATLGITTGTVKSSCARALITLNHQLTDGEEMVKP